jgi:anti-sigma factor RsiW
LNIRPTRNAIPETDPLPQNIVSDHIRSLIGTHLLDVPSTDQHTVKPWFNGKLDFSPEVKDFASQGFPLIGGRLEYLMDRPVAALVYQRRQHIINVFTWPATSTAKTERSFARNGYVALHWNHGSMTFWAVSDISSVELSQFENLYEK